MSQMPVNQQSEYESQSRNEKAAHQQGVAVGAAKEIDLAQVRQYQVGFAGKCRRLKTERNRNDRNNKYKNTPQQRHGGEPPQKFELRLQRFRIQPIPKRIGQYIE